jgi:hypothetical protein
VGKRGRGKRGEEREEREGEEREERKEREGRRGKEREGEGRRGKEREGEILEDQIVQGEEDSAIAIKYNFPWLVPILICGLAIVYYFSSQIPKEDRGAFNHIFVMIKRHSGQDTS